MNYAEFIDNKSILGIIRRSCNYVDPRLINHGYRVAGIIWKLMHEKGGYTSQQMRDICFLSMLHDIGAYKTDEISKIVQFETENVEDHSVYGYLFVRYFSPLEELAPCILHHHTHWRKLQAVEGMSDELKEIAQLINLADRIDVGLNYEGRTWEYCMEQVGRQCGWLYDPALAKLVLDPGFGITPEELKWDNRDSWSYHLDIPYSQEEISAYLMMLVYIIDFRSRHTVTHTITTTSVSMEIAGLLGLDERYIQQIVCGAVLHDLGKIGIPVEILEFPGRLSPQAMAVMRTHVDLTENIFGGEIEETVANIALRHHEKLDGSGYPRGLKGEELSVGERLVAVADIVSALTGTRSYKEAYAKERVVGILANMKNQGLIDPVIVDLIIEHYDTVMMKVREQSEPILERYEQIQAEYRQMCPRR